MIQGVCCDSAPALSEKPGDVRLRAVDLPFSAAEVARRLEPLGGLIWLDSSLDDATGHSILTAAPTEVFRGSIHVPSDWERLAARLRTETSSDREPMGYPAAGLFGWVGYEGRFVLGDYPRVLVLDHASDQWFESGGLSSLLTGHRESIQAATMPDLEFSPLVDRRCFMESVRRAQEYIGAGDIYQVNLAYPWEAHWPESGDALSLYERLRDVSPAPHAAYLHLDGRRVLSASPETYLRMSDRHVATRPIKGTRPRFPGDPARDEASRKELLASEKERAELLMITDLERNDLGRVCEFGSVHVPELWEVESFAQVYHFVSTVEGRLREDMDHAEAFRACFPGGSITGAPKKRAMEIISELEPFPREIYTGAIGYFGFNGESQWNIAIRTAVQEGERIRFHVGSGIVADSVPADEHEETLHKAAGILSAARQGW